MIACLLYFILTASRAHRLFTDENVTAAWVVWGLRQLVMVAIWVLMFVTKGKEINYGFFALTTMIFHFSFEIFMSPWA